MSCGVGCRRGSDPALLWLWHRLVARGPVPIGPLAWEPPYAEGAALKRKKKEKKKKKDYQHQMGFDKVLGTEKPVSSMVNLIQ